MASYTQHTSGGRHARSAWAWAWQAAALASCVAMLAMLIYLMMNTPQPQPQHHDGAGPSGLTHSDEKPEKCKLCMEEFSMPCHLASHLKRYRDGTCTKKWRGRPAPAPYQGTPCTPAAPPPAHPSINVVTSTPTGQAADDVDAAVAAEMKDFIEGSAGEALDHDFWSCATLCCGGQGLNDSDIDRLLKLFQDAQRVSHDLAHCFLLVM